MKQKQEYACPFSQAKLTTWKDDEAKAAILICPGGGYSFLSSREDEVVAEAFNALGWQPMVLHYSINNEPLGNLPLREIAWATAKARELSKKAIFACGFSAGAHVVSMLAVHYEDAIEDEKKMLARPDGIILAYPVISAGEYAHEPSMKILSGQDKELRSYFSAENFVKSNTPPAFVWHTSNDQTVPAQNALLFCLALAKHKVPFELHIFPYGAHGLSLATQDVADPEKQRYPDAHVAKWLMLCDEWINIQLELLNKGEGKSNE